MERPVHVYVTLMLALCLAVVSGCEKSDDADATEKAASSSPEENEGSEPNADDGAEENALLDAEKDWEPCDIMPPDVVADTFGVPRAELETMTVATCVHRWKSKDGKTVVETELGNFFVKKKPERAMRFFENATKQTSKEQADEEREELKDRTKKKLEEDETDNVEAKKKGVDALVDAIGGGEKHFEEVDGLGDKARINTVNGNLYVVDGNLLFRVNAWHGAPTGEKTAKSMDAVRKAKAEHMAKNYDKQKTQTVKLAKAILAHVDSLR